jgi:hypothetical protein
MYIKNNKINAIFYITKNKLLKKAYNLYNYISKASLWFRGNVKKYFLLPYHPLNDF